MSEAHEAVVKVFAILVALSVLWLIHRTKWAQSGRRRVRLYWGLVALGALGYVNFGGFHTDGTPFHLWDQYHYVIGSKYFPELGYDGLYAATIQAFEEHAPKYVPPARVDDLRTHQLVPTASQVDFQREVRARFSAARWDSFLNDATHFYLRDDIFLDNGYLATPTDVAVERLFTSWLPFRQLTLTVFASLDFILLALAGWAIYRAFGLETLAAAALVFGFGYCSRFYWIGGAFLRDDMIAALVLCAAALACNRVKLAGAALAYATCARIFPVFMLLPLGVFAIAHWQQEKKRATQFAMVFGATVAALVVFGCFAGRGPGAWVDSAHRLIAHSGVIAPNAIGLRVPFSTGFANLRGDLVNPATLYDYVAVAADFARVEHEHMLLIALVSVVVLALCCRVAWTTGNVVAAFVAGVTVIYTLTTPNCYYGSFFVLLLFVRPTRFAVAFLLATVLMYGVAGTVLALSLRGTIRLNGAAVYAPVSILLLGLLIDWLIVQSKAKAADRVLHEAAQTS
jgi:hypothetical protein